MATLKVRTIDAWTTEFAGAEDIDIEADELVFWRKSEDLGRYETRLDLDEILWWRTVEVHSGLER